MGSPYINVTATEQFIADDAKKVDELLQQRAAMSTQAAQIEKSNAAIDAAVMQVKGGRDAPGARAQLLAQKQDAPDMAKNKRQIVDALHDENNEIGVLNRYAPNAALDVLRAKNLALADALQNSTSMSFTADPPTQLAAGGPAKVPPPTKPVAKQPEPDHTKALASATPHAGHFKGLKGESFFASGKTELAEADKHVLDQMLTSAKSDPSYIFNVLGLATGTGAHNEHLAEKRAAAAVAYLESKGVTEDKIHATHNAGAKSRSVQLALMKADSSAATTAYASADAPKDKVILDKKPDAQTIVPQKAMSFGRVNVMPTPMKV